jgi:hypothetical protein
MLYLLLLKISQPIQKRYPGGRRNFMSVWFGAALPPEYPFPPGEPGAPQQEFTPPPVPMVFEKSENEGMSLRVYAAIQLRVPESGIEWLDKMIERSRELDSRAG